MMRFHLFSSIALFVGLLASAVSSGQPLGFGQGVQAGPFGNGLNNGVNNGQLVGAGQNPNGAFGGGQNADFASLIDLIMSTVQPDTWIEAGGVADIRPFPNGVWVDATGVLQRSTDLEPVSLDVVPAPPVAERAPSDDPRRAARLRVVSLTRLEREISRRLKAEQPLDESMLTLAGLRRVQFVFVYPESGEIALAGPAGDWRVRDGRIVADDTGAAIVRLDDLLELWRRETKAPGSAFGCSITPRQESLAATQAFLDREQGQPLAPGRRDKWVERLRATLGRQDIELYSMGGGTHAARVLIEADYHMKRIGIGLEPGVAGVDSYLTAITGAGNTAPASSVLRWWFATNYQGVAHNGDGTAFELRGQAVRVLSENEMLTERGERIHTGVSDLPTQQFAHQFTQHFDALATKYPVYSELRNLFDLGIVAALLTTHDLPGRIGWQPSLFSFSSAHGLAVPQYRVPREVDTIANHTSTGRNRFTVVVSGGVWVDAHGVLQQSRATPVDATADLDYIRREAPAALAAEAWWWDAEE